MKYLHFKLIAVLLFSNLGHVFCQKKNNDWTEMELKGKVKSIIDSVWCGDYTERAGDGTDYTFNEFGFITERHFRLLFYKLDCSYKYIYDSDGRLIRQNWSNEFGGYNEAIVFKYDSLGNQIEKDIHPPYSTGRDIDKYIYTYDKKGLKTQIRHISFNRDSVVLKNEIEQQFKYDSLGNIISEVTSGINKKKYAYKYDYKGNVISKYYESLIDKKLSTEKNTYKYDTLNRLTEEYFVESYDNKVLIESKKTIKYDINGNKIEIIIADIKNKVNENEFYTFDENGNWITYKNVKKGYLKGKWVVGKPYLEKRIIQYY